jgi:hypothetical protein
MYVNQDRTHDKIYIRIDGEQYQLISSLGTLTRHHELRSESGKIKNIVVRPRILKIDRYEN